MRIGHGYDVHRLVENRKLVLGGICIDYEKGLLGHSDADVLIHAIMDALLGAAGLGDIGRWFPDSSARYKDISSLKLLDKVKNMLLDNGFVVNNIDCTIVAECPKLSPYVEKMKQNIADVLGVNKSDVNIKATTTEGLGFCGEGHGMEAYAVATIRKPGQ